MNIVSRSSAASPARISTFVIVSPGLEVGSILRVDIGLNQRVESTHKTGLALGGIPQHVVVPLVAEQRGCLVECQPAPVVRLVVEAQLARLDLHQRVADALATALRI